VSEAEAQRLIAEMTAPYDLLVMLLAHGGLRIGEAFALRRRSVDIDGGSLTVSRVNC
jgi:integrase